ncbi:TonB-dependent receptor [Williamwhitmania taraxaci]|uniref:Iron complex outermembrane recepter protein n=1 Tax=Williamwhitmania taraxaci TaxID=1640674 RepID=A0A1G6GQT7_9BACT|nr:TonB-dependent receptor [Williamwhitmania taraxaci]SDB84308.1 iron complex outermembrane recepter protein [Williamwhitmania taraxaci]
MKNLIFIFCLGLFSLATFAESGSLVGWQLKGSVVDESNNPLIGASVALVHTFKGAYTNQDGLFEISGLKAGKYSLRVSYMGYLDCVVELQVTGDVFQEIKLLPRSVMGEEVVVSGIRANSKTPMTVTTISKAKLNDANGANDLPLILGSLPSVVSTSESGGGIGNTAFRIRGVDPSRINVTLNGIPLNDAESQTVFWVDLPDLASSISSLQVQRGVGASTNGAGAFGGTVSIQTLTAPSEAYGNIDLTYGAFNTQKVSVATGSGLIHDKFSFDVRYSKLKSDGYVDHSGSDHTSLQISGARLTEKSVLRANFIMGEEHTDISWNGVPSSSLDTNRQYNPSGLYYDGNGLLHRYAKEQDNYFQNHYQLIYSLQVAPRLTFNAAAHLTVGRGYYEEYKDDAKFSKYLLTNQLVGGILQTKSDFVQQKWLNNQFYGGTYSLNYKAGIVDLVLGGGANRYNGDHFGKLKWVEKNQTIPNDYEWYFNNSVKDDFNSFFKAQLEVLPHLTLYGDMQYRYIYYKMKGPDSDNKELWQTTRWDFLNPKVGASFLFNGHSAYASFAVANREPARSDLKDASKEGGATKPKSERLFDYELGYGFANKFLALKSTIFLMDYKNQLVNTGKLNEVGYPLMTNVAKSYRAGIEVEASYSPKSWLVLSGNLALTRNRITDFVEYVDLNDDQNGWNPVGQRVNYLGETNISFSPEIVSGGSIMVEPLKNLRVTLLGKQVGKQYIDNSSSNLRKINGYAVLDSRLEYRLGLDKSTVTMALMVNNILDREYLVNGWVYRAQFADGSADYIDDGYFPQAGRNVSVRLTLNF